MAGKHHRVGVDIGGTFTDLVLIEDETGRRAVGKVLTTPEDPSEGVESGLAELLGREGVQAGQVGTIVYRGGFGQDMEIGVRSHAPWVLSAMYDRTRCPAQGIECSSPGAVGAVRTADGKELHPKRQQRIGAHERVVLNLPGGGGYEDPLERDPELVARDVEDALISVERARELYGVVLMEGGRPGAYAVNAEATARRRAEARGRLKGS